MAKLAHNYYENLQNKLPLTFPQVRETTIRNSLASLSKHTSAVQNNCLGLCLTTDNICLSLCLSQNGKATGLNGIPYEFWKLLQTQHDIALKTLKPATNIIKVLTRVYNNIEHHGVVTNTNFIAGWLCPLYKKKDQHDIANYCPITLLNSDHKFFTKALATKLVQVASSIIHRNQAGFLPGWSIFNQVKLSKLMIDYAEVTQENRLIVSLD